MTYLQLYNTCTRGRRASILILLIMGAWRPKHVEWLCRNKTCTVLHQVGVSFDLSLCVLGHVLRCHICSLSSVRFCQWQHVKWACVWALSRRTAPSWQRGSAHVCKISSCHSAMWVPTAKSPTLQSRPSSLGLFSIPSYEKSFSGYTIFKRWRSQGGGHDLVWGAVKRFFFQGYKVVATKVGEVYWVIRGLH